MIMPTTISIYCYYFQSYKIYCSTNSFWSNICIQYFIHSFINHSENSDQITVKFEIWFPKKILLISKRCKVCSSQPYTVLITMWQLSQTSLKNVLYIWERYSWLPSFSGSVDCDWSFKALQTTLPRVLLLHYTTGYPLFPVDVL